MQEKGSNILDIKRENRKQILTSIKNYGALPRKDIAKLLNLTPAAVTIITNEMLEQGLLIEKEEKVEVNKRAGRKKVPIDINYNLKYVVGISIESESIAIGLCNLKGEMIDSLLLDFIKAGEDEHQVLNLISDSCMKLLWNNNIKKQDILGVGVGIIGLVNTKDGISNNAYGIFRKNVPVKKILEDYLGVPVCIDNNVRALALAEISLKANENKDKFDNMVFVKYGPGIGAAIVINSEIYEGSSNNAGELGHTIVNYSGELCKCGKKGCLETIASQTSIVSKTKKLFSEENTPFLFELSEGSLEKISLLHIVESAEKGEKVIVSILEEAAFYFATALSTAITLYDPREVVFYGEAFKYDFFLNKLKVYFKDIIGLERTESIIKLSKLQYQNKFLGGAALALKRFFYDEGGS